jgi:hypothetical protein
MCPVGDELPGLSARGGQSKPNEDVVEPQLQQAEKLVAGGADATRGPLEYAFELALAQAVVALGALLRPQLLAVLGAASRRAPAVLSGCVRTTVERSLAGGPALALQLQVDALASFELARRFPRTCHRLHA